MRKPFLLLLGCFLVLTATIAQAPRKYTSSESYQLLQKINFLGSALYIAAHPDDENTRLISYLSNKVNARTGYLSITRGDGGQNLIGTELRELLGVLRTQELLAARRVDGGVQFFTRANDFGYSKHPNETLRIWDKQTVLGDVVRIIRDFRPDIIINRFDHRTPGSTHGHHTSSAILSVEAFDLSGKATAFPDQLESRQPWTPRRLFHNTSWWFYGSPENFEKANKENFQKLDIGAYYPMLGKSNNEIAAKASSQHLSQGFGRLSVRGSQPEYVELLKGDLPKNEQDLFEGIDTSWSRVSGGEAIGKILTNVEANFNFVNPAIHLPDLLQAFDLIQQLEDDHWRAIKSGQIKELITAVSGLYLEATASDPVANPGSSVTLNIEAVNRSNADMQLVSVAITDKTSVSKNQELGYNEKVVFKMDASIPERTPYTSPYWLSEKGTLGMYKVADPALIGRPVTPRALTATFNLTIEGRPISFKRAVVYRFSEPDKGELYEPFEVLPEATARFEDKVLIFNNGEPREVPVSIMAHKDNLEGEIELCTGSGWQVERNKQKFSISKKGEEASITFILTPPENEDENYISPIIRINGKALTYQLEVIPYPHIPKQSVLMPAEAKVVRLNLEKAGRNIGYIKGAGDEVAKSLEQIGYTVERIEPSTIQKLNLDAFDAIVVGIRAYNVSDELKLKQPLLLEYAKNGGTLILQYNTAGRRDRPFEELAPYPLTLSRDRVTDENSEVSLIAPDHPIVNFPNTISQKDFKGWVQERGLYFPNQWDNRFTPVLSMNDEGE
ncbi:MAG: PIG-L family deacetylase, partial [Eudoraea sp.]|nr:PIG-L family deacetylase [Eudoraea sp.]NNJ41673.1 PIG-L family deacetylase [Eudoraea sp.]